MSLLASYDNIKNNFVSGYIENENHTSNNVFLKKYDVLFYLIIKTHIYGNERWQDLFWQRSPCVKFSFPTHSYCHSSFHRKCHKRVFTELLFPQFTLCCLFPKNQDLKTKKIIFWDIWMMSHVFRNTLFFKTRRYLSKSQWELQATYVLRENTV